MPIAHIPRHGVLLNLVASYDFDKVLGTTTGRHFVETGSMEMRIFSRNTLGVWFSSTRVPHQTWFGRLGSGSVTRQDFSSFLASN